MPIMAVFYDIITDVTSNVKMLMHEVKVLPDPTCQVVPRSGWTVHMLAPSIPADLQDLFQQQHP